MRKLFNSLSTGTFRLLIAGWVIVPILTGFIVASQDMSSAPHEPGIGAFFIALVGYSLIAVFIAWIADGYRKDSIKNK